jgi:hypothetical protein
VEPDIPHTKKILKIANFVVRIWWLHMAPIFLARKVVKNFVRIPGHEAVPAFPHSKKCNIFCEVLGATIQINSDRVPYILFASKETRGIKFYVPIPFNGFLMDTHEYRISFVLLGRSSRSGRLPRVRALLDPSNGSGRRRGWRVTHTRIKII